MNTEAVKKHMLRIVKNKYVIVLLFFYVWLLFFDQHSIWERKAYESKIEVLEKQKAYYLEKIQSDKKKIHELQTSKNNLEKFAREQYLMKKENEDIFIFFSE